MVNLKPSNIKLKERVISIVMEIVKCDRDEAIRHLEDNNWSIKQVISALGL